MRLSYHIAEQSQNASTNEVKAQDQIKISNLIFAELRNLAKPEEKSLNIRNEPTTCHTLTQHQCRELTVEGRGESSLNLSFSGMDILRCF